MYCKNDINIEQMYKKDISSTKLLSRQKQLELLEKAQMGDDDAKNELIVCNLRFILKTVLPYSSCKHIKQCDLINEGVMGLIRAIETFDATKGFVFISYAIWWIKVYIKRAIIDQDSLVKLPETVLMRIKKHIKQYSNNNDLPFDVYEYIKTRQQAQSYDKSIHQKSHLKLSDILEDKTAMSPEHSVKDVDLKSKLTDDFLTVLPEMERYILEHSYGIGCKKLSMDVIAKKLNIGIVTLRNLKEQALDRIRQSDDFEFQQEQYQDLMETEEE